MKDELVGSSLILHPSEGIAMGHGKSRSFRGLFLSLLLSSFILHPSSFSQAGLYNTAEQTAGPAVGKKGVQALPFSRFQSVLANLRSIGVPQPEGSLRRH
ncbi:MAG TPA: hypothetical protein VG013_12375, partial [Gemmataceae bacterium]|nr:hypothetical protein [Gemmataceae bacterium]